MGDKSQKPIRDLAAPRLHRSSFHKYYGDDFGKNFKTFTAMATAPASPKKEFVVWRMQVLVHKLKKKQKDLKRKQVIVLKLKKKQKDLKQKQVIVFKLKKKQKDLKQLQNELKNEIACLKQKLVHDDFHE